MITVYNSVQLCILAITISKFPGTFKGTNFNRCLLHIIFHKSIIKACNRQVGLDNQSFIHKDFKTNSSPGICISSYWYTLTILLMNPESWRSTGSLASQLQALIMLAILWHSFGIWRPHSQMFSPEFPEKYVWLLPWWSIHSPALVSEEK